MLLAAELGRPLKGTAKKLPSKPSHGHEGMWTAQARPRMGEATKGGVNFTPCLALSQGMSICPVYNYMWCVS